MGFKLTIFMNEFDLKFLFGKYLLKICAKFFELLNMVYLTILNFGQILT